MCLHGTEYSRAGSGVAASNFYRGRSSRCWLKVGRPSARGLAHVAAECSAFRSGEGLGQLERRGAGASSTRCSGPLPGRRVPRCGVPEGGLP